MDFPETFAVYKMELVHASQDGGRVAFDLEDESDGTQRLLSLLTPLFRALDQGTLIAIDELNHSLHTQACEALPALFVSRRTNSKGAQLIATTHDTNLLRSPCLRRDQIWFTEKDGGGGTHLYPLRVRLESHPERASLRASSMAEAA